MLPGAFVESIWAMEGLEWRGRDDGGKKRKKWIRRIAGKKKYPRHLIIAYSYI